MANPANTPNTTADDWHHAQESMLAATLAARAYEAERLCLGRALASLRRLTLEPEQDGYRHRIVLNTHDVFVHHTLLQHYAWLTDHAEDSRLGRTGLTITAQPETIMDGIDGLLTGVELSRLDERCPCGNHHTPGPIPIRELPLTVITGKSRNRTDTVDGRGAMHNDFRPVIESGWAKHLAIPFRDFSGCAKALYAAVNSATSQNAPGLLLIARGGDITLTDYQMLAPHLKDTAEIATSRQWCIGTAIGHSHPQQRTSLDVPWTEPTPSVAAHNLVRYRQLIEERAQTIETLHELYTHHPAPGRPTSMADAEALWKSRVEYLQTAGHLGNIEAALPNAILKTLRLAESLNDTQGRAAA